jgi:Flp pilus assembly pilin Flp
MAAHFGKFVRLARLRRELRKRATVRLLARALRDEHGGEVLEYAIVAGLIVVGAIGAVSCVGAKVLARWNSLNSSL